MSEVLDTWIDGLSWRYLREELVATGQATFIEEVAHAAPNERFGYHQDAIVKD
jgi:hypothetical protein